MTTLVPKFGQPRVPVRVDPRATEGAVFGENLFIRENGELRLLTAGDLPAAVAAEAAESVEPVAGETTVSSSAPGRFQVGLADVPNGGGGTLQKFTRDAKGRLSGTSTASTDDLQEGSSNLYFTQARAQATPLPSHTVAALPTPTAGLLIYVTDESGGAVPAFGDGTNFRRVTDRAIVS